MLAMVHMKTSPWRSTHDQGCLIDLDFIKMVTPTGYGSVIEFKDGTKLKVTQSYDQVWRACGEKKVVGQ